MRAAVTRLEVNDELVSSLHAVQFEWLRGRMDAMQRVRGPGSALYLEAEHLRAAIAPSVPNPSFNQMFLSGPVQLAALEEALALFAQHGMTPRVELGPGAISEEVARLLAGKGFVHCESDPVFVGLSADAGPLAAMAAFEVSRVVAGEPLEAFKAAYLRGWCIEAWLEPALRSYMDHWVQSEGWSPSAGGAVHRRR